MAQLGKVAPPVYRSSTLFYDRAVPNLRWRFLGDSEPPDRAHATGGLTGRAPVGAGGGDASRADPRGVFGGDQRAAACQHG
eukprot:9482332-Pyramimonas_sp.AAC.1